jgi:guanylate kinase
MARFLITSALPYINGIKHLGNLAGSMLPADVHARFRRMQGHDVLFDIDWQGAQQLTNSAEADVVKVFILPPSMKDLRARLESRAQDSSEVIKRRLSNAYSEISRWDGYDYVLVNEDLDACYDQLRAIITAERLRRQRQPWLPGFVQSLLKEDT